MNISNFVIKEEVNSTKYADVDVTTGFLFWKKTKKREICRENVHWFFTDTGEFTPGYQAENFYRAFVARNRKQKKGNL